MELLHLDKNKRSLSPTSSLYTRPEKGVSNVIAMNGKASLQPAFIYLFEAIKLSSLHPKNTHTDRKAYLNGPKQFSLN